MSPRYELVTVEHAAAREGVRGGRVYLAGPMTGVPEYNHPAFNHAASLLRGLGIPVHNPAEQHGGRVDLPHVVYMRAGLAAVLTCAAVVTLPGWEHSKGAKQEVMTAHAAGIPCYALSDFYMYVRGYESEIDELAVHSAILDAQPPRASVLHEAAELITGDRNNVYGPPTQDFTRTAGILTALGFRGPDGGVIASHHVAMIIASVKLSRLVWSPLKRDNWTDLAGYAGCGYECAVTHADKE